MGSDVVRVILASDVANAGTFTLAYPPNKDSGAYVEFASDHYIIGDRYGKLGIRNGKASFTFGASTITITNGSGVTLVAGTEFYVNLDQPGDNIDVRVANPEKMAEAWTGWINLGAPDAAVANGAVASQAATALGGLATGINGGLASGGVATFDVPRNVVAAWTGTSIITVTGTDEYGRPVRESSASGTSLAGKKAFKTVTGISVSADVTGLTVGSGDVLGLPMFLPEVTSVMREAQDGAAATAGTVVAGVTTKATALTGDVRGTYDPNAACDGAKAFSLFVGVLEPGYHGGAQFAG